MLADIVLTHSQVLLQWKYYTKKQGSGHEERKEQGEDIKQRNSRAERRLSVYSAHRH